MYCVANSVVIVAYEMTTFTPEREPQDAEDLAKRVLRKIDWRLIPLMFITYNLNFMDKTILSSASVFGLREDTVGSPHQ